MITDFHDSIRRQNAVLKKDSLLVFACGAATTGETTSVRSTVMEYAKRKMPKFNFFKAERFFETFENSNNSDYLTIEEELAKFSDCVLIVIESPGAHTELGAFTVKDELAEIVLAVNKEEFRGTQSFISKGPLAKIDEVSKFGPPVYADFSSITEVAPNIEDRLSEITLSKGTSVSLSDYDSFTSLSKKKRLLFILDIISIFCPIQYSEIIGVLKYLYGEDNHLDVTKEISLLRAMGLATREDNKLISLTEDSKLFYKYRGFDVTEARALIIRKMFKTERDRLDLLKVRQ